MNKVVDLKLLAPRKAHLRLNEGVDCETCPTEFKKALLELGEIRFLAIEKSNDHCDRCHPDFLDLVKIFDEVAYVFDNIRDKKSWRHAENVTKVCKKQARFIDLDDAFKWLGNGSH